MILDVQQITLENHSGDNQFVADVKIDDNLDIQITNAEIESIIFVQAALQRAEESGIFPDECYYKLSTITGNETINCEWILVNGFQPQFDGSTTYSGKISKVECILSTPQTNKMSLTLNLSFDEIINIMGYLGLHFKTKNFGIIDIKHDPAGTFCTINCIPIDEMAYPEVRLTELLRFCTGTDINWISGIHGARKFFQPQSEPLFKERHISMLPQDQEAAITLFDSLSDFLLPISDATYSPVLDCVVNVCQAQKNILNYRLVVGAAVEYLMKNFYNNIKFPEAYYAKLDSSLAIIKASEIEDEIKRKIEGAIANYKKVPPKKILALMKNAKIIKKEHINAYESIRNSGAHGDDLKITEVNNLFLKASAVLDLIFRIILNGIQFSGIYYSPIERQNAPFEHKTIANIVPE